MPRWEAVATFALVAFILSILYYIALLAAFPAVKPMLVAAGFWLFVVTFWLLPSLMLLWLAIPYNVWRREHILADAIILTPVCFAIPLLAVVAHLAAACSAYNCLS